MKLRAALSPIAVALVLLGTTAAVVQSLLQGSGRRIYFISGWLLVVLVVGMLVLLRRRQLANSTATYEISALTLSIDALLISGFIAVLLLHLNLGLPDGRFEYLLFGILVAIALVGLAVHASLIALRLAKNDEVERCRQRLNQLLDLQIPLLLASLPVMLLHGVLSHAHGALSHLVKGGQL